MMQQDSAPLRVLYMGGTGTISTSCVRLSVESGMRVFGLNRGHNSAGRELPEGVTWLRGDVTDGSSVASALGDRDFDAVVNFLSYDADDARRSVAMFEGRTRQYVYISSASVYGKPVLRTPVLESTPTHNRFLEYARAKLRAEHELQAAYAHDGFPVTIVRPAHTYDDAHPPLPGDWTVVERIARGAEIPVHGDGTSLWTLTHADDFALGLVGLLGNPRAVGETFHITSDDVYTWDQIYTLLADACGARANILHVPTDALIAANPAEEGNLCGDKVHCTVFDNSKLRRLVPGFRAQVPFAKGIRETVTWLDAHPDHQGIDEEANSGWDRLAAIYEDALRRAGALSSH